MERMQLLEDPLEQARLLNEVPEVIAYIAEVEPAMHFAEDDREELNGSPESPVGGDSLQTPNADMDSVVFSCETGTRHALAFKLLLLCNPYLVLSPNLVKR